MNKLVLTLFVPFAIISCQKDEIEATPHENLGQYAYTSESTFHTDEEITITVDNIGDFGFYYPICDNHPVLVENILKHENDEWTDAEVTWICTFYGPSGYQKFLQPGQQVQHNIRVYDPGVYKTQYLFITTNSDSFYVESNSFLVLD